MTLTDHIPALLPDDWELLDTSLHAGAVLQAVAPAEGGFRSAFTVFAHSGAGADASLEAMHENGMEHAWLQMTDALLIDHSATTVGGREAFTSTVAYRHGPWTLTAVYWTISAPDAVVAVAAVCDADLYQFDGDLFTALTDALVLGATAAA
jgi:hypothetical protein